MPTDMSGVLRLPDGSKFKTTLYNMKVIGQLRTTKKLPYFILAGTTCTKCDENTSIYIHSPSDGPMKNEGEQPRFPYPGRLKDNEGDQLVSEARMFYGNCLPDHPNSVVWFERGLGDDNKWRAGVQIAEVKGDRLVRSETEINLPKITDTEPAIRDGRCHELPGIDGHVEP